MGLSREVADDLYVNETGDVMSGTLGFVGPDVDDGGAIRITGPGSIETSAQLYGASTGAFAPEANGTAGRTYGIRFTLDEARALAAVRWYRAGDATAAPAQVEPVGRRRHLGPLLEHHRPPRLRRHRGGLEDAAPPRGAAAPARGRP